MLFNNKKAKSGDYLILNGWMIAIVIIVVSLMFFAGVFDFLKYAAEKCEFGDGIRCVEFAAETNDTRKVSNGDEKDMIIFEIENLLEEDIKNMSIVLPGCGQKEIQEIEINSGSNKTYIAYGCKGLEPKGLFQSKMEIRYKTGNVAHRTDGFLKVYVSSPAPESYRAKAGKSVAKWIRENVG